MTLPLAARMQELQASGRKAFIPFLTAGFPTPDVFRQLLAQTQAADFVEVGLPFSDPIADGPTICHASDVALAQGMHATRMFDVLSSVRNVPPLVLMTYVNPVLAFGAQKFFERASSCGVQGVILTDVPPEDSRDLLELAEASGIASVLLVSPTTPEERMRQIAARTSGFLYCVAVTGTTGARARVGSQAESTLARLRRVTKLPVVVGFGISSADHVRQTCRYADGVVVGSSLVELIRRHAEDPRLFEVFEQRLRELSGAAHPDSTRR